METQSATYMLIFRDSSPDAYRAMSPEQRQQLLQQWNDWCDALAAQGKLQQGNPLEQAGRVVVGASGRVTDGPFAEAKEAIGGFFMLAVGDMDEATAIAQQCPGLAHGIIVEVRPVAECCPVLRAEPQAARQPALA